MIWSKRNSGSELPPRLTRAAALRSGALAGLVLLTTACGAPVSVSPPTPAPPSPPAPGRKPESPPALSSGLGLQPLPSPAQVSAAVSMGRPDPFLDPRPRVVAPPPAAGGAQGATAARPGQPSAYGSAGASAASRPRPPAPPTAPPDFQFNGLIQSRGRTEALVQYRGESGSVAVGYRGSSANPLLPAGWRVEAIDSSAGVLRLQTGRGVVRVSLSEEPMG